MTEQKLKEVINKAFVMNLADVMHDIEKCEDNRLIFHLGMHLGYFHRDLQNELLKELNEEEKTC